MISSNQNFNLTRVKNNCVFYCKLKYFLRDTVYRKIGLSKNFIKKNDKIKNKGSNFKKEEKRIHIILK